MGTVYQRMNCINIAIGFLVCRIAISLAVIELDETSIINEALVNIHSCLAFKYTRRRLKSSFCQGQRLGGTLTINIDLFSIKNAEGK